MFMGYNVDKEKEKRLKGKHNKANTQQGHTKKLEMVHGKGRNSGMIYVSVFNGVGFKALLLWVNWLGVLGVDEPHDEHDYDKGNNYDDGHGYEVHVITGCEVVVWVIIIIKYGNQDSESRKCSDYQHRNNTKADCWKEQNENK